MKIKSVTSELKEVANFIDNGKRSKQEQKNIIHAIVDYVTYILVTLPLKGRLEIVYKILFKKYKFENMTFEKGNKEK